MAKEPKKEIVVKPKRAYTRKAVKPVEVVKIVESVESVRSAQRSAISRSYSNAIRRRKALAAFDRQSK